MSRARVVTPRRRKTWAGLPGIAIDMTGSGTFLGGGLSFVESGSTLMRLLGEYTILPTSAAAAGDEVVVNVALGIVSTDAFTLGATAVPDPGGEAGYPWLYWAAHPMAFNTTALGGNLTDTGMMRHTFDIKSQRKIGAGQILAMVVEYADLTGAPPLTIVFGQTRVLIALP